MTFTDAQLQTAMAVIGVTVIVAGGIVVSWAVGAFKKREPSPPPWHRQPCPTPAPPPKKWNSEYLKLKAGGSCCCRSDSDKLDELELVSMLNTANAILKCVYLDARRNLYVMKPEHIEAIPGAREYLDANHWKPYAQVADQEALARAVQSTVQGDSTREEKQHPDRV